MSRRLLSMLLAVVLLAGLLVAFTPGDEREAKAALGPLQAVTLTAADFHPGSDEVDFENDGRAVYSDGIQVGRIPFPAETVVLTSVKVYFYDNAPGADLSVTLFRARPRDNAEDNWGGGSSAGKNTQNPQTLSITAFKRVGKFHAAYLWVTFTTGKTPHLLLYGATVFYRVVT